MAAATDQLRAYVEYLRDLGIHDLYRQSEPLAPEALATLLAEFAPAPIPTSKPTAPPVPGAPSMQSHPMGGISATPVPGAPSMQSHPMGGISATEPSPFGTPKSAPKPVQPTASPAFLNLTASAAPAPPRPSFLEVPIPKPTPFDDLIPLPQERVAPDQKSSALQAIHNLIGDCTRCPLAYAGRRKIVFGDGDPNARLMFIGEGPGADEDASGIPFVGKAGQLLNNMIAAMGLKREEVYIANIVKCRPPANRTPEPVEANTCSPFLLEQIDVIRPQVIVALGGTAATYLLGVKQSLASLRGTWHSCRGAKVAVTYHPAFLLRDPTQKGEAWKDLQRVMAELGLKR